MSANAYRGDPDAQVDAVSAIRPQNYASGDVDGAGVDLTPQGNQFHGVRFHAHTNNGDASDSYKFTVQESSDDGSSDAYTDVTDEDGNTITGTISGADGNVQIDVRGNLKTERYLRLKLKSTDATVGGASTDLSATAIKTGQKYVN